MAMETVPKSLGPNMEARTNVTKAKIAFSYSSGTTTAQLRGRFGAAQVSASLNQRFHLP